MILFMALANFNRKLKTATCSVTAEDHKAQSGTRWSPAFTTYNFTLTLEVQKVVISAPSADTPMFVMKLNHTDATGMIVSNLLVQQTALLAA